jgi:AraC-like DNA-binding protein
MAYVTKVRMSLAEDLLDDSEVLVRDVSERVGYGSVFAFSTAFKRHCGASPSAFRAGRPQRHQSVRRTDSIEGRVKCERAR